MAIKYKMQSADFILKMAVVREVIFFLNVTSDQVVKPRQFICVFGMSFKRKNN